MFNLTSMQNVESEEKWELNLPLYFIRIKIGPGRIRTCDFGLNGLIHLISQSEAGHPIQTRLQALKFKSKN